MMDSLKKLFIQEVKELLQSTENSLLALEKDHENKEIIADIFRAMHTIKGSAGVYNLDKTVSLSHSFENLFQKIKEGQIDINNKIISLALKAKDIILELIESENEDSVSDEEIKHYTDTITDLISNCKEKEKEAINTDLFQSFYILFEPNTDIVDRGINIDTLLKDFDEFEFKIITKFSDSGRTSQGKLEDYYEIIVSSDYSINDLKSIFLFTPKEFKIKLICEENIFAQSDFTDFYNNGVKIIPDSGVRLNLLIEYISNKENNKSIENVDSDNGEENHATLEQINLIGLDETQKTDSNEHVGGNGQQIEHIRVEASKLDELLSLVSELIINNSQLVESVENKHYSNVINITDNVSKITNLIKENTLSLRLVPVKNILAPYRRMIRDLSLKFNKKVKFLEEGFETLVDKSIVERLFSPLSHIIRNAIDHGIESPEERIQKGKDTDGVIRFIAYYSNSNVIIQIQDDGNGMDPEFIRKRAIELGFIKDNAKLTKKEIYDLVFLHGFTTSLKVTDISGRGVGMDAIKTAIQELRGNVEIDSEIGLGTSITITLPQTLSIIETLHVSTNNMNFLLPLSGIDRCLNIKHEDIENNESNRLMIEDEIIPYIDIRKFFDIEGECESKIENMIIIKHGKNKLGLIFETINGEYQAVIKHLGSFFTELDYLIGATILGDNSIGYIIDPYKLMNKVKSKNELH